ncbi:hypothetical protein CLV43_108361 [Umezawaea tangerina]|uniref:Transposase IS4-like domain-containing protein n=1 Tax=Umezawaea tangerina TaxID=84725 RepID=A0A2T0SZX2_9PSEU|nr:hypothetical protein CLV43_108361 [Umezawaea tangerina]
MPVTRRRDTVAPGSCRGTAVRRIGAAYDPVKLIPIVRYGEQPTLGRPLTDVRGRAVLDVAGGTGFYAIKTMIVTDKVGGMLFCGATTSGSTANITQARQSGLVTFLKNTMGVRILADAGYQGLGTHTAGQVVARGPARQATTEFQNLSSTRAVLGRSSIHQCPNPSKLWVRAASRAAM